MCLIPKFYPSWVFWATAIPSTTSIVINHTGRSRAAPGPCSRAARRFAAGPRRRRRQPRSIPIARHQLAPRAVGLRSCGPPCPSLPAGSCAAPAPRRAPPPPPRRSVPSTASGPGSADGRDPTCAVRLRPRRRPRPSSNENLLNSKGN